jgi:hypothetical protein
MEELKKEYGSIDLESISVDEQVSDGDMIDESIRKLKKVDG